MQKVLFYFSLCFLLWCCNDKQQCDVATTHISGEIVNPTGKYIYLYQNEQQIDSILLDENNRFSFTHDNLQKGLYNFRHNEFQTFFLTPGDSIVFRVNTIDFDESLHFSGSAQEKNNLLLKLYLNTEKTNNLVKEYYNLPPQKYVSKIDSLNQTIKKLIETYHLNKKNVDTLFEKIANSNIDYTNYLHKELYISNIIKNAERAVDIHSVVPQDFLNHREEVKYNNASLQVYFPYYRYLNIYFDNVAFENYADPNSFNRKHYQHSLHKLKAIESKLNDGQMRNVLSKNTASVYIANTKNEAEEKEVVAQFLAVNTNPQDHNEIKKLAQISLNHIPGKTIPNLQVVSTKNEVLAIHEILIKPSVLYFWSYTSIKSNKDLHIKARELASKYPEYDFIAINTDTDFRKWHKTVTNFKYNVVKEFQLEDKLSSYQKLHINSNGKAMIVHKDGTIIQGNTSLNSFEIENELLGFLNL